MKITLNQQDREEDYLFFIAKHTKTFIDEDNELDTLVETLFQLSDDSFVIRIDKRLESTTPGTKVEKQERMKSYIT
ncbi:MAG: hypothetical protein IPF75_09370 [Bacteroidetes bacterium]|nr:hypothetical protein [Bacteroidota bacterium]